MMTGIITIRPERAYQLFSDIASNRDASLQVLEVDTAREEDVQRAVQAANARADR